MAQLHEWMRTAQADAPYSYDPTAREEYVLQRVAQKAWEFFDRKIAGNFFFNLLGVTGRIARVFEEIFGPRPR